MAIAVGIFFAIWGTAIGIVIGFVPSLVVGVLLTVSSRWRPFDIWLVWTLAGAVAGTAMATLLPLDARFASAATWIAGGAAAMLTYWVLAIRILKFGGRAIAQVEA